MPRLIIQTFYQKYKLYKLEGFFFFTLLFLRVKGVGGMECGEERGEAGGETQLCQWSECTIKIGVTTKVRADLTVNTVRRVESGKGEL